MKVNIEVQSTKRYTMDIGQLSPAFIKELILQDEVDGYFLGGTDWSLAEMGTEGDTTIDKVLVEEGKTKGEEKRA